MPSLLIDAVIAIGIGLFIGLEREQRETVGHPAPHEALMGVRTFALLAMFGWLSGTLAVVSPWLPVAALGVVGGLMVIAARSEGSSKGLTTEVAGLATFLLGLLVHHDRLLAIALGLATMLLLISKPWFQSLVPKLQRLDLTSTLQLAILLAIVLPLLPDAAKDPWGVLSPRRIGLFVALIAGLGYVGYLLNRMMGSQRGFVLTGLVGGLASSTALTVAMAQQARAAEAMVVPGQVATLLATLVMSGRVLVVAGVIDRRVAVALALPLGAAALLTLGGVILRWKAMRAVKPASAPVELQNPFSMVPALKWGAIFTATLLVTAIAQQWLGTAGLLATAALSGAVDVDAITLAATRQSASGDVPPNVAALAVMIAVGVNACVKAGIALFGGGRRYGLPILAVFGASTTVGVALAVVLSFY